MALHGDTAASLLATKNAEADKDAHSKYSENTGIEKISGQPDVYAAVRT
ncbi:hypothetical protein [Caballeronia sp. GAFFF2]|jgi:hypothetical protein|nr:hypothetical protein [Caballeronia sp. GAFFF2]